MPINETVWMHSIYVILYSKHNFPRNVNLQIYIKITYLRLPTSDIFNFCFEILVEATIKTRFPLKINKS